MGQAVVQSSATMMTLLHDKVLPIVIHLFNKIRVLTSEHDKQRVLEHAYDASVITQFYHTVKLRLSNNAPTLSLCMNW